MIMNEKLLSERMDELAKFLHSDSVIVKSKNGRIKVYPKNDDGEISSSYPICQTTIDKIITFCRFKNLGYFVSLDVWTEIVCFTIYQSDLD